MTFRSLRALAVLGSSVLLVVACAQGSPEDESASDALPTEPGSSGNAEAPSTVPTSTPAPAATSKGDAGSKAGASGTSTSSSSGGTSTSSSSGGTSTSSSSGSTSSGGAAKCPGYALPTQFDLCNACGSKPCQANGCYGGYYCRDADLKCVTKPSGC